MIFDAVCFDLFFGFRRRVHRDYWGFWRGIFSRHVHGMFFCVLLSEVVRALGVAGFEALCFCVLVFEVLGWACVLWLETVSTLAQLLYWQGSGTFRPPARLFCPYSASP